VFGVSAGLSFVTGKEFAASGGGWIETPLGPLHAGVAVEASRLFQDVPERGPLASDLVWTTLSLRYGGDRAYWPGAHAGVGPVITAGSTWLTDAQAWIITAGLQLYGAD